MSLRVWLPLDGNLENKGISNIAANVQSGVVVDNNGKIGKCYTNSGTSVNVAIPFSFITKQFSLCAWVKINTRRNNWCRAFGLSGTGNYIGLGCEHTNGTGFGFHFYKTINGTNTSVFDTYPLTFSTGTWAHFLMAYDGTKYYIYKNGALIASANASQTNIEANMNTLYLFGGTANNYSLCSLNDVRIYDHCLSAAEVHEISQGLVLHYKLDGFQGGYGNPNIIVTHSNAGIDGTGTSGWSAAGTGWSNSFVSATGATGGYAIRCTYANTSQTSGGIHHPTGVDKTTLTTGDIYTLSARIRTSKACVVTFQNELMTTGHTINATTDWQVYTYTCAIDTSKTYQSNVMYVRAADAVQNMWIECDWIKLEKGTAATPWQPSGIIGTAIQDSSGYGHNGTIVGFPTLSSDTARYSASTYMNATSTTNHIDCGQMPSTVQTISFWFKKTGNSNFVVMAEPSSGLMFAPVGSYAVVKVATSNQTCYDISSPYYIDGQWNHIVVQKDGTTYKLWTNGVQRSSSGSNHYIHDGTNLWLFNRNYNANYAANGQISDFRVYTTLLSEADIKQLYEVGAKVDNNQGWHTFEYIDENSKETITKTGKTMGHNIIETYIPLYDKTIYTEPDGSKWIHIFHHNNPANSKFDSPTTDWLLGKYMDANRWYDVDHAIYNSLSPYEFMVKQKTTSSAAETKYRWRQTANPLTATWNDVKPGTPTFITTSGYTSSSMGGLYIFKSSNLHMCIANGSNGNWFGGIGAASAYNSGIPGYPNTTVTDGYIDLYIRVYANAKIIKTIGINAANLIEF